MSIAAAFAGAALQAQTVTVGPSGYLTAGPGATQQLTATVTGTTGSTAVTGWLATSLAEIRTVGTISTAGLYTAPTVVPASGMTQVTAELASNPKKSGTQYIYLLSPGPQITSVTPSPLAAGTITVTIAGSGFQTGATVMDGPVQMSTISITPTTIKATTYQPPATSATFMVRNPSSVYGNMPLLFLLAREVLAGRKFDGRRHRRNRQYWFYGKHWHHGVNRQHRHYECASHFACSCEHHANYDTAIYRRRRYQLDRGFG